MEPEPAKIRPGAGQKRTGSATLPGDTLFWFQGDRIIRRLLKNPARSSHIQFSNICMGVFRT